MNRSNCKLKTRHIMIHLDGNEGGGIRSVSEAWYQGFTKRGINVSYLMNRKGKYAKELYDKGNEVHCANVGEVQSVSWNIAGFSMPDVLGWGRSLSSRKIAKPRFEKILQDIKPDVVLGNGASSAAVVGPACKSCGVDIVSCFHGVSNPKDFLGIRKHAIAYLLNHHCREIVGVSQATLESKIPYLRIPYHVIYNAVPELIVSSEEKQRFRNQWNISDQTIVFGTASRISASKAIHRFVDAAKEFLKSNPYSNAAFLIAGDPISENDRAYLKEILLRINKGNLQNSIRYVGYQPIAGFYSAIDVFCHTIQGTEGLGLTIVEALSAGLPVIVSNEGGFLEFLPDNIGIRYDANSYNDLAVAMKKMLDNVFRQKQSEMGKKFFLKEYISFTQWIDLWLKILLSRR